MSDPVNNPKHYKSHPDGMECIELVEMLPFCQGNAIKYLWRKGLKGPAVEDLRKARWYVDRAGSDGALICEPLDGLDKAIERACGGFEDERVASAIALIAKEQWSTALRLIDTLIASAQPMEAAA